jgi:ArsR family transcriptional regulator
MLQGFKAELFKALGHPVRIRILELLRDGERTVSELQEQLEIEMSSVSQQLAVLRTRQLVEGRKSGTSVHYQVVDPQVFDLLDTARAMFQRHLASMQELAERDAGR